MIHLPINIKRSFLLKFSIFISHLIFWRVADQIYQVLMENMALVNWNAIKEKKHLIEFSIYISYRFIFRYKVGHNNQLLNRCSYVWRSTDSGNLHQHCHQKLWVNIAVLRIILTYAKENRSTYHIFYVRNVRISAYSARASTRATSWSANKFLMVRTTQKTQIRATLYRSRGIV